MKGGDEVAADGVGFVVGFVGVAFWDGGVTADGGDVDHAVSAEGEWGVRINKG